MFQSSFVSSNTSIFPNGIVAKARSFSGCCLGSKSSLPICCVSRNWMNQTSTTQQGLIKHGGLNSTTSAHGMRAYNSNKTADLHVRHSRTPRSKSASDCNSLFAPNSCVYCTTRYNKCGRIGTKWVVFFNPYWGMLCCCQKKCPAMVKVGLSRFLKLIGELASVYHR